MLIVVTLSILFMWMLVALSLIGIGSLLLGRLTVEYSLFDSFWAGLCIAIAAAQIYHFFRPIDVVFSALLLTVGALGIALARTVLLRAFLLSLGIGFWATASLLVVILVIAVRCSGPFLHYDTGFYGAMAVRWFITYPIAPGLTNLMGQLGLNSSVFLGVALLNQGPWHEAGYHVFVGLLLCALVSKIVASFTQVLRGNETPLDYFILLFSIPGMVWALNGELVGTNTDLPTTIVSIVAVIFLFDALKEKNDPEQSERRMESLLLTSLMLFTLAVTFKISSLALCGIGWAAAAIQLLSLGSNTRRKRQLLLAALILSCSIGIPWIGRGAILSGYPFFPSSAFALPVDWRVPRESADGLAHFNRSWARIPHAAFAETAGARWLRPWFSGAIRNRIDFIIPMIVSFVGLIVLISRKRGQNLFWLKVLVPSVGGLLFWFALAPAFRFGESAIWITAACLGTIAFQQILPMMNPVSKRITVVGLLAIGGWCSYPRTLWKMSFQPSLHVHSLVALPTASVIPYVLSSGLTINVPTYTNQCWDTTIPCSPNFSDNLKLRRGTSLRWGFKIDGSSVPLSSDKFTPLHRRYIRPNPVVEVCANCHFPSK